MKSVLFFERSHKSVCVVLNHSLQSNDGVFDPEGTGALIKPSLFSSLHTFGNDSVTSFTIQSAP